MYWYEVGVEKDKVILNILCIGTAIAQIVHKVAVNVQLKAYLIQTKLRLMN